MSSPLRLGILLSGGGTTFLNLHQRIVDGSLEADIACVISSSKKAAGFHRAQELGYPAKVISRRRFSDDQTFSLAMVDYLIEHKVDLVVLAGFLKKFLPASPYETRCINIHPSLIPAFCGQGYYGMHVHRAVWARSCKLSGCTVHLVNSDYDEGPIILQKAVAIDDQDTPESIQRKVFALECEALPEAISYFAQDRIRFEGNRSVIQALD